MKKKIKRYSTIWHGKSPYTYIVYDENGMCVYEGTRKEVSEYLGVLPLEVFRAAKGTIKVRKRYTVEQIALKDIHDK